MPVPTIAKPSPISTTAMGLKQQKQQLQTPSSKQEYSPTFNPEVFTAQYVASQSGSNTPYSPASESTSSHPSFSDSGYVRPALFVSPSEDLEESEHFFYEQYSKKPSMGLVLMGLMPGIAESLH